MQRDSKWIHVDQVKYHQVCEDVLYQAIWKAVSLQFMVQCVYKMVLSAMNYASLICDSYVKKLTNTWLTF